MKNVIAGTTLFIGGTLVGFAVCKRLVIDALSDEKFTNECTDVIVKHLLSKYGPEKIEKIVAIINEKEVEQ